MAIIQKFGAPGVYDPPGYRMGRLARGVKTQEVTATPALSCTTVCLPDKEKAVVAYNLRIMAASRC